MLRLIKKLEGRTNPSVYHDGVYVKLEVYENEKGRLFYEYTYSRVPESAYNKPIREYVEGWQGTKKGEYIERFIPFIKQIAGE